MELTQIPEAFQSRLRLMIVSALVMGKKSFTELKSITAATDGNLSVQISKLEQWGYLTVEKLFVAKKPMTVCKLTPKAISDFKEYVEMLNHVLSEPEEN
ncbi:MAG: transcriptional regulator [Clostridia bacterium]|nr:transcriptional regulator [Clostridia bacterium]